MASKKGSTIARKTMARLIAVQLLYRQAFEPVTTHTLLAEFKNNPSFLDEDVEWVDPDLDLLNAVVQGVDQHKALIEEMLHARITEEQKSETLIAAILRAGIYELIYNTDTPVGVVISDYLSVASAFFDGRETALINGVLDQVGKMARPAA